MDNLIEKMQISEIRCYHNGCPKRKFFNSLPIEHIFIYATVGSTDVIYAATGYCVFEEDYDESVAVAEKEFKKIVEKLEFIRVFKKRPKPKYYKSLNALAFRYEVKTEDIEKEGVKLSLYIALRINCQLEQKTIAEIKVLEKNADKTEEAAFLKLSDSKLIDSVLEALRKIGVYEEIKWDNITEKYFEEKTPTNEFRKVSNLGFPHFSQQRKAQDLQHFFRNFLPEHYSETIPQKEMEFVESREPKETMEEQYERVVRDLRKKMENENLGNKKVEFLDIFANVEKCYTFFKIWIERSSREPENFKVQSSLSSALGNLKRSLMEAELFLRGKENGRGY